MKRFIMISSLIVSMIAVSMLCLCSCTSRAANIAPLHVAQLNKGVNLSDLGGWDIVTATDALPSESYAAEEFQTHVELATGIKLPIVNEAKGSVRHVFIGPSRPMRQSKAGFDTADFAAEDLRIVIREGVIVIAGGRPRGTLYGVYTFLEDYFGVRFLTADHTHVPPVGDWRVVGPVDRFYHPPLEMRWSYYGEPNRDPSFAARLRTNAGGLTEKQGGMSTLININHSFFYLINSSEYGEKHPEYYCEIDGKRRASVAKDVGGDGNQPCLTNPDVLDIVTEKVLAQIESYHPGWRNFPVSQNDNSYYCRCVNCAAIDEREGTPMGSLLTFVNAVADRVAEKHPDVWIGTLSYSYTRKPPVNLKPRPNVHIQLCSIECCVIHPINDPNCPKNVRFCGDLTNWSPLTDKISIWNYNTNFRDYLLPCPNLRVIEQNVRFFVANKARGIFMQAAGDGISGEFSELRNYLIANLLWDPNRSGTELIDEFLSLHYRESSPPIKRYIDLIHDAAEDSGVHRHCFARKSKLYGIDPALAVPALELFAEARSLARSDDIRARVDKASIPAYRLAIDPVWAVEDPSTLDQDQLKKAQPLIKRFLELCDRFDVDLITEATPFETVRPRLIRLMEYDVALNK